MSLRNFFGEHFGADAVLWSIEDDPKPSSVELKRRLEMRCLEQEAEDLLNRARRRFGCENEIAAVERVMAQGGTGLTDTERSLLPALLERLRNLDAEEEGAGR